MPNQVAHAAVDRLANPTHGRTEADLQTDVSIVLLSGGLNLTPDDVVKREVQVGDGTRRRIDVQLGHLVIEVKRDLSVGGVQAEAEAQLAGYVRTLTERDGRRYAGVLTDGRTWWLYSLAEEGLRHVTTLSLTGAPGDDDRLVAWLDTIMATREGLSPSAAEITARLGAASPSHQLAQVSLTEMYEAAAAEPEVSLKRQLWAKLLRTAFGEAFVDDRDLFVNHTLLVLTAEAIAHAVLGFDLRHPDVTPRALARGDLFADAQVFGVVEADFFDWVLDVPGGPEFVTTIAHRVAQFDWSAVEHDVLKVLYESVIDTRVRQSLGEFYTPDWLADRVVAEVVSDPLTQRVLDPACGSGTFIFHAVRAYLAAAAAHGQDSSAAVHEVTKHVMGIDIHPVAVTFARVTYMLALGRDRLTAEDRGPLTVPIYLGDSLQWEQHQDLLTSDGSIVVPTTGSDLVEGAGALFGDDLTFPAPLLADAHSFDRLVARFADAALNATSASDASLVEPILNSLGVHDSDRAVLRTTFATMRRLHREGRDHIWGYYVRNLVRPLWLAQSANRVDVLVGNPPWLRYSKMTSAMQERYKALAKPRGLLRGGLGASARDLSTLFVARSVELYLKDGGRFGFVMPHGVMSRKPHEGFRSGDWSSTVISLRVRFEESWDLENVTTGFPITSCVILGMSSPTVGAMPAEVKVWTGRLTRPDRSWADVHASISVTDSRISALSSDDAFASVYASRFRQGAILVPRVLLRVNAQGTSPNPLGPGAGRVHVRSHTSPQAKEPWKSVEPLTGTVERRFVHPMVLGETVAAFRLLQPAQSVLPLRAERIMTSSEIAEPEGLAAWWAEVERVWKENRKATETAPLYERMDYHAQLSSQLPAAGQRVVYTASGATLVAARVDDSSAVIEHAVYWAAVSGQDEARYLLAVLNSHVLLDRVRPLQSRGLFGPRHFDKHVWRIAVPTFERSNDLHQQVADLARTAEEIAAAVPMGGLSPAFARKAIGQALKTSGVAARIEEAVDRLLPTV